MKYKYRLTPPLKATVEWQLASYKADKQQLELAKHEMIPSPVQGYSLTAGVDGGEAKRTTEEVTVRMMTAPYIRRLEIQVDAIERAFRYCDSIDMKLIDLIFWRKGNTAEGAGMKVGLQKSAVYQRLNKILGKIALEMGYIKE